MNQKLSDWANVAQIVSGIAVVITLVFLIVGIRENTDVTRAAVYQQSSNSLNEWRRDVLSDPEIARLFGAFLNNQAESIDGIDRIRLTQLILNIFQISESAFYAQRYGLLGTAEWSRFERSICDNYARARSARLAEALQLIMTKEFMEYIAVTCEAE
jgi:erythromycin esterase-like protein